MEELIAFVYRDNELVAQVTKLENRLHGVFGYELTQYKNQKPVKTYFFTKIQTVIMKISPWVGDKNNGIIVRLQGRYVVDMNGVSKKTISDCLLHYFEQGA